MCKKEVQEKKKNGEHGCIVYYQKRKTLRETTKWDQSVLGKGRSAPKDTKRCRKKGGITA